VTPERWREVRQLFDTASELEGKQREEFLARACANNESLLADVEFLLRSHEAAGSFIEEPLVQLLATGGQSDADTVEVRQIGPWAVEKILGQGGMGTVYLASRADDEYRQRAAIKVLRLGLDSEDLIRRFRGERQILADLNHPNIARLLEGGTLEDERPYLVMEYVEGQPFDSYCDSQKLPIARRLELFVKMCSAVQFAHQRLIVHRDLKPGNILVTEAGEPKLLDFGIAKLLSPESSPQTQLMTEPDRRPMTLAYASPEQVTGASITTASDVYSLGVVLYELLTGRRPYPSGQRDLTKVICEHQPRRPSTVVGGGAGLLPAGSEETTATPALIAEHRSSDQRKLARTLGGDLDNIVLKALRKEPQRRYVSAEAMAQDVVRYLTHRPVFARPDTLAYRGRKFVRRNRLGVAAAAIALVALMGFLLVVVAQRNLFLGQKLRAEEVTQVMIDLFEVSDPDVARGRQVTAREVMDRGATEIRARLRSEPDLLAGLLEAIGRVYTKLGVYESAGPLLEDALELRREVYGSASPKIAPGLVRQGELMEKIGNFELAEERFREALSLLGKGRDRLTPEFEQGLSGLAATLLHLGQFEAAEALNLEALELSRRLFGDDDDRTALNLKDLGTVYHHRGRYPEARAAYSESLAIYRNRYGDEHPEVAGVLGSLALVRRREGEYDQAEELLYKTIEIQRRQYDGAHPGVATAQINLAAFLRDLGRFEEAEQLCLEALAYRRELYPPDHPKLAGAINLLGLIRRGVGDRVAAEAHFREALEIWTKRGDEFPEVSVGYANLALVLSAKGETAEAEKLWLEALRIARIVYGDEHPTIAAHLSNLGRLARLRGDFETAQRYYLESLKISRRLSGEGHPDVARTTQNLAIVMRYLGDYAEAERLYRKALGSHRARLGEEHAEVGLTMQNLASTLTLQGRPEESLELVLEALEILEAALPDGHSWRLAARSVLGESLTALGRYAEAEETLLATYALVRTGLGDEALMTVKVRERLIQLYEAWGRPEEAAVIRAGAEAQLGQL